MTREPIRSIQTGLNALGHAPGPIDGLYGNRTREATERWLAAGGRAARAPFAAPRPATGAVIYQGNARHPVREIAIHCAATRHDWMAGRALAEKVTEIRRWHVQDNGWRDIGYHWILDRDGRVLAGRAETVIGAGIEGHNQGVIHICLLGGHGSSQNDLFAQHFTRQQDITLRQMIDAISSRTGITRVSGHNEHAARACPGFHVPTWLKGA